MRPHLVLILTIICVTAVAAEPAPDTRRGDDMLQKYFAARTRELAEDCLTDVKTLEDWTSKRAAYHQQLLEMLGLDPLPERTPLMAEVTGKIDHDDFTVEKVYFQSRPGLYVTGNLYIPKGLTKPAPTILYVCGHSQVVKDGVSLGGKTHYQHHACWFARHGYVCLVIDTLQLGEIQGIHHGTYRYDMWWWLARGYTPAGVEAWNCIRALDYLQTRKEVDGERIGVTGRSGGGAYSWWIAALDERIKAAVPVAGITDLENHVIDGAVEGHCDCMFMLNTYRWDYAQVAAMVAPRPLLIANTDKDGIFPLEGIERVHQKVRHIYRLYGADKKFGLQISEGPHWDVAELQVAAFRWFNRFLKEVDTPIEDAAKRMFEPEQLKVLASLPADQQNTTIHETFVPVAKAEVPESASQWGSQRDGWLARLKDRCFRAWPDKPGDLDVKEVFSVDRDGMRFSAYDFTSQEAIRLRLYLARRNSDERDELVVLNVLDEEGWSKWLAMMRAGFAEELKEEQSGEADPAAFDQTAKMFKAFKWAMAYMAPRGVGPTAFDASKKKQVQNRRRFMLLGESLDGMQVWDARRAAQTLSALPQMKDVPLWMQGERQAAGMALYAALFEPQVKRLDLWRLPASHREGPYFLNVLRFLDTPQAVAMAAERTQVRLYDVEKADWQFASDTAAKLGWNAKQLQFRNPAKDADGKKGLAK